MNGGVTIIDLMDHVFPRWFAGDSWRAWRVALKAMFALPLDADEFAIFQAATGRATPSISQRRWRGSASVEEAERASLPRWWPFIAPVFASIRPSLRR